MAPLHAAFPLGYSLKRGRRLRRSRLSSGGFTGFQTTNCECLIVV